VGLDPTSGLFVSEGHIPLCCTPDPVSAAPITGETAPCEVDFSFSNTVKRLHEDPRVTKPYSEAQWQSVLDLGQTVDEILEKEEVRLTMGGEPTFVSIDDMESPQWNTAALGEHKLARAQDLLERLKKRFAPNGIMQQSQGKWYPTEALPRWAMGLTWRKDGHPLWDNADLLLQKDAVPTQDLKDAKFFLTHLATQLGLPASYCQSVYEDVALYQHQIDKLPKDVDLSNPTKEQAEQYKDLIRFIRIDHKDPAGFILPIAWCEKLAGWQSSTWPYEKDSILLIPGDSPPSLRLPLDTLPKQKEPPPKEPDPFTEKHPLTPNPKEQFPLPAIAPESKTVIKHCLGSRMLDNKLTIFIPPLDNVEQFIQVIAAIEITASTLHLPIVLEGYECPTDPRINKLFITPDPGVIEVNIHPAENFEQIEATTTALYQEAREARLATEKFMLDGRHTGTGGGNHITLGAKTPKDSPILRRPDLLRSLVTYWQHHPSLSYLFSGMFIGPTSQAPRVDEGRDEMLYELEIAFSQVPEGETLKPWLVDRLFRNLLVDVTGNTHRAEFCIDKLYSPTGLAGRLGLLEFRGFEMPPHSRMALVQQLLIRSLIAYFWQKPYNKPLIRFGTALHDKYMLPHYVFDDSKSVINELNDHGIPFHVDWLLPFEEFRFPYYGRTQIGNIQIELRFAIEPWHVLGEEVSYLGTSRYVDSSVERLQVKVYGLTDNRYVLSCNHRRVPLTKTDTQGVYVAGIRYRAWHPPSGLHPTIQENVPLVFDLIDTWNNQVIGGCCYNVSHPGGRSYDTFPVNAFEAESRRYNRFTTTNCTQQPTIVPPAEEINPDYPQTLDLRRPIQRL
ncbi:MAG: transglutaminase family protein, partial [Cellvibrionales bacterium]|nr:transglutaminase family protein [Cellvibrionales bacterium]